MDKRELWAGIVFLSIFLIDYIDSKYTIPKMKESSAISEMECKQESNKCWIKVIKK